MEPFLALFDFRIFAVYSLLLFLPCYNACFIMPGSNS